MTKQEFVEHCILMATDGYSLPAVSNMKYAEKLVDTVARRFWDNDDRCSYPDLLILKPDLLSTCLYKQKRQILLPECVIAVTKLSHAVPGWANDIIWDTDFGAQSFLYASMIWGNTDSMLSSVALASTQEFRNRFILDTIGYNYNEYTKALTVRGTTLPGRDLVAEITVTIPQEYLYSMVDFEDYVVGELKKNISRVIGFSNVKLLGGFSLEISDLRSEGESMIEKIEEKWKAQEEDAGFMIFD